MQFAYDDRSVVVVNSTYRAAQGLKASAKVYDFDLKETFSKDAAVDHSAILSKLQSLKPTASDSTASRAEMRMWQRMVDAVTQEPPIKTEVAGILTVKGE